MYLYIETEEEYIAEDHEVESGRNCKAAQHIQQNILQELRGVVGGAQTLSEDVAHDLILQVFITVNNTPISDLLSIIKIPMIYIIGQFLGSLANLHWLQNAGSSGKISGRRFL